MIERVLVVGATGMLGAPVAAALRRRGLVVRALVRDAEKARRVLGDGYELARGDVMDGDALQRALDGCQAVHVSLSGGMDPRAIERIEHHGTANVAVAAARAGVRHLTYLSGGNTSDTPLGDVPRLPMTSIAKSRAEDAIRRSGVPYTMFRATMYMETLPQFVRGTRALIFGAMPSPFRWIAAADYAELVARALGNDSVTGKALCIKGPQALTMDQALTAYRDRLVPSLKIAHVPLGLLDTAAAVSFNPTLREMAKTMRLFGAPTEPGDPSECDRLLGPLTTTLDRWCDERRAAVVRRATSAPMVATEKGEN